MVEQNYQVIYLYQKNQGRPEDNTYNGNVLHMIMLKIKEHVLDYNTEKLLKYGTFTPDKVDGKGCNRVIK